MSGTEQNQEPVEVPVDDLDAFKRVFRRHAAGVAAVTALDPAGKPVGFTATSLASLAAIPPLATFNMARIASAWPAMTVGNHVAIHTLGPRTKYLAEKLSGDHDLRFTGDHWTPGPHGVPILAGVTSWMLGRIIEVHPVHDSAVVIVQIETGALGPEDEALLYHERSYRSPGGIV
jgi:flavin reductase (DIM6/NTAB) family NADH-FMN oxidoreductase RutF